VQFFGADFVVIPGAQLVERMRSFYTFCRDHAVSELAASGKQPKNVPFHAPDYPADLVASDAVGVTHHEVEGMGLYADFGPIEEAFADPSLLRHPDHRRRVRDPKPSLPVTAPEVTTAAILRRGPIAELPH
jgi:hypothetical protein